MKAMSAEGRMHWLQWKWEPSCRALLCKPPYDTCERAKQVLTGQTKAREEKNVFPSEEYVCVTLGGRDHKISCHSKFSNQFSKSELRGGLEEEPKLMYRAVETNVIQWALGHCVSYLETIGGDMSNYSAW